MEFAGKDYIYLSKLKKEKIKKVKKSEENNQKEAPIPTKQIKESLDNLSNKIDKPHENFKINYKNPDDSEDSDDAYLSVDSNNFNIDLVNNNINMPMNQMAAPGVKFKKAIDTNVCVIRYNTLEKEAESNLNKLYKCQKCNCYLNKYSKLNPTSKKDIYEWKCEFCFYNNKDLFIESNNLPKSDCVEKCIIEPQTEKEENKEEDDTSLIFCLDKSGSMSCSYSIDKELEEKFNKIRKKEFKNKIHSIDRLEMVKISIENIINSLLKKSPKVKVGFVTFSSDIEVKGDCLSNIIKVKEEYLGNESKLESLGKENTNLIKSEISKSFPKIIEYLRSIEAGYFTALGPAILLSLSLLDKSKPGSRIFLCTDGESNSGVGSIWDRENAINFYTKIGNMAKEKGIVISLIAFEDSNSEIDILKNMVENSGGDIFRVNPKYILDEVNDFLENKAIASDVEFKMNLNKCMTFRDEEKNNMSNEDSTILKKIGNITREKEDYFELKFKHATKLSEINEINFDELNHLIFQIEIIYKKRNGGKYIRIITKNLKVSDDKEEINKQADFNIVSTLQIQKSAKLAGKGNMMDAQVQIHVARNFLNQQAMINYNNLQIYNQYNMNMNSFNYNLGQNMNMMNNNMRMNNMMNNNMGMYNMMNNNMSMNNMMNNNMGKYNMMNNYMPQNNMMNNYMPQNNMMNNNMGMNINMNNMNDMFSAQIHSLSNTSQSRQCVMFNRLNQK